MKWARVALTAIVLGGSAVRACVDPVAFGATANNVFLLAAGYTFGTVTK